MKTKVSTIITALLFIQFSISQTVHTVDNSAESGAQYTSVATAISAASAGDIIYIHPSPTSYGSITVDKTLTLVGPGHNPANSNGLQATLGTITLTTDSANSEIKGLNIAYIQVLGTYGITNVGNIHIINNRIGNNGIAGYFTDNTVDPNWVIEGNYFDSAESSTNIDLNGGQNWIIQNNVLEGIIRDPNRTTLITNNLFINADTSGPAEIFNSSNDTASPLVVNNMFIFTDPDVTEITSSGSMPVDYVNCLLWNSGEGASSDLLDLPGSGNLNNVDPLFTNIPTNLYDFYNNDYTLGAGSLAIGASTEGGDIGIFGRNFPFDVNGRPHSMPYPTEMIILNTVVQPGQDLNVTFKASQKN